MISFYDDLNRLLSIHEKTVFYFEWDPEHPLVMIGTHDQVSDWLSKHVDIIDEDRKLLESLKKKKDL